MADLDRRLTPLIETLTAAGIDWLAFEIEELIRTGFEEEESFEELEQSRRRVRDHYIPKVREDLDEPAPGTRHLTGEEQIEWAAGYVAQRLDDTLSALTASIENLNILINDQPADAVRREYAQLSEPTVVIMAGEEKRKADREGTARAQAAIPGLRTALERWTIDARGPAQT